MIGEPAVGKSTSLQFLAQGNNFKTKQDIEYGDLESDGEHHIIRTSHYVSTSAKNGVYIGLRTKDSTTGDEKSVRARSLYLSSIQREIHPNPPMTSIQVNSFKSQKVHYPKF